MAAPSGSGKTHILNKLGEYFDVPVMYINFSMWTPLSYKGNIFTITQIAKFIYENPSGIIIIDKIDKTNPNTSAGANAFLLATNLELHALLDGEIPDSALAEETQELKDAINWRLKNKFFIVGAGAFNNIWEDKSPISLQPPSNKEQKEITKELLSSYLFPELSNRFRKEVVEIKRPTEEELLSFLKGLIKVFSKKKQKKILKNYKYDPQEKNPIRKIEELITNHISLGTKKVKEPYTFENPPEVKENLNWDTTW